MSWLINLLMSWFYGETTQKLISAGIQDLVSSGLDLGAAALKYAKEANDANLEDKFGYVQEKMMAELPTIGKSALNSAIELAVSALKQGK